MTMGRILSIVARHSHGRGYAVTEEVRAVYGAGFEGAIKDAVAHDLVVLDRERGIVCLSPDVARNLD